MRRTFFVLFCAMVLLPLSAQAAPAQRVFSNRIMAFSARVPDNWQVQAIGVQLAHTVLFLAPHNHNINMSVRIIPIIASSTVAQTTRRAYRADPVLKGLHFNATSIGGRPAMVTVLKSSTEGGLYIADLIYITQWNRRVYEIIGFSIHKPPYSRISQFPAVYQQILRSWRWL